MHPLHKAFGLSLLLITSFLLFPVPRASACSCSAPVPPSLALQRADVVFEATVTHQEYWNDWRLSTEFPFLQRHPIAPRENRMNVIRVWKGEVTQTTAVTADFGSTCDYSFELGHTYVVYARLDSTVVTTSICDRTAEVQTPQAQADLAMLGVGTAPFPAPSPSKSDFWTVPLIEAIGLFLLLICASIFRSRLNEYRAKSK